MNVFPWIGAALVALAAAPAGAVGNFADVTVYDRTENRRLPVYWHQGKAWVPGRPGNEYQITVRNRRGEDLLAVVSVDGINVITGETASPQQSGYVLSPWRPLDIAGWRKSLDRTAAFYFTDLPDSYAGRTGRPDDVGVIGVALFQRKRFEPPPYEIAPYSRRSAPPSADERSAAQAESAPYRHERDSRLGTGWGRSEESHARYGRFERASSVPVETITIHYDSYRNLVARGVIRDHPRPYDPTPRPFPGFAPEPHG